MGNGGRIGGTTGAGAGGSGMFGKGMMTWTLPLFAFGSIAFLVYTLGKVSFNAFSGQGLNLGLATELGLILYQR